jgi:hypothetical protein
LLSPPFLLVFGELGKHRQPGREQRLYRS